MMRNIEAENMRDSLRPFMSKTGYFGYVCAKNFRKLNNELSEYDRAKNDLIIKYGTRVDKDGQSTYSIQPSDSKFEDLIKELDPIANALCDFSEDKITKCKIKHAIDEGLTGDEILSIFWMLEDDEYGG